MIKPYQNIEILDDNSQAISRNRSYDSRAFYNEEKWDKYIKPLLPEDCEEKTFIEIGCAEGLFLKKAKDAGFEHIVGIEVDRDRVEMAKKYRNANNMNYTILHRKAHIIGNASNSVINELGSVRCRWLSASELPASDVVLLSNFHYFLKTKYILNILDVLSRKTVCCIIVSWNTDQIKRKYKSSPGIETARKHFRNWEELQCIEDERMYSIRFNSGVARYNISEIAIASYGKDRLNNKRRFIFHKGDTKDQKRKCKRYFRQLRKSIEKEGIREPVLIDYEKRLIDGNHRIWIEKNRGARTIIARQI